MKFKDIGFLGRASGAAAPTDYSNLEAWWDAAALVYADGTEIDGTNVFTDRSSNARHASQAGAGLKPLCKTGIINGHRVVRFDGVNDYLSFTSINPANLDYTIIFVGTVTGDGVLLGASGVNIQVRMNLSGGNTINTYFNSATNTSNTFGIASTSVRMSTWRRNGGTSGLRYRDNKTDRTPAQSDGSSFTLEWMGSYWFGSPYFTGDVGELLVYKNNLSDADVDNLYDNYFKSKWGLP